MNDTSDLSQLANEVRLVCQRISRRVRFESTHEVAPHQFSVLSRLSNGEQTPTQLAEHERVSTPSMTRTINCLQERGLVERRPHPTDGRQVVVSLSETGRALIASTLAERDTWMAERLEALSAEDLDVVRRAVKILEEVAAK